MRGRWAFPLLTLVLLAVPLAGGPHAAPSAPATGHASSSPPCASSILPQTPDAADAAASHAERSLRPTWEGTRTTVRETTGAELPEVLPACGPATDALPGTDVPDAVTGP